MITIYINSQPARIAADTVLAEALRQWPGYQPDQPYALAVNGEFIARSQYSATALLNDDKIDVVSPVGGG